MKKKENLEVMKTMLLLLPQRTVMILVTKKLLPFQSRSNWHYGCLNPEVCLQKMKLMKCLVLQAIAALAQLIILPEHLQARKKSES
ncbi:MAG: hypothetical protein NXI00_22505 [Cytophagales bacterium]|nr:hypothetical protein [Cytophagales bacterium]